MPPKGRPKGKPNSKATVKPKSKETAKGIERRKQKAQQQDAEIEVDEDESMLNAEEIQENDEQVMVWNALPLEKKPKNTELVSPLVGKDRGQNGEDYRGMTPQQRWIWETQYERLPIEVRERYESLLSSENKESGKQKLKNALVNAVISRVGSVKSGVMVAQQMTATLQKITESRETKYRNAWNEGRLSDFVIAEIGEEKYKAMVKAGALKEGQVIVFV